MWRRLFLVFPLTWFLIQNTGFAIENDTIPSRQLDEVIITAQKQEENIQNVPVSVSTITEIEVRNLRLWNNRDLNGVFPNFSAAHSGDGRTVIGIRGINTTSYDQAVATYIDGVLQFDLDTYINTLLEVERIEVLRGPQGTLYGRNAMGGVINIITKKPTNQTKGFAGVDFGNYGLQRFSAGVNLPIVKNKLFFGASGLYEAHGGFFTNQFTGTNFDERSALLGNYFLRYLVNNQWAMTLNIKHNANRNFGAFPLAGNIEQAFANPFQLNQNAVTRMVDDVFNASLSIEHTGEKLNFNSHTSFQSNYRIYEDPIDGDFSPLDIVTISNNFGRDWNNVSVWIQEFRLSSAPNENRKFDWLVGMFGFLQDEPVKQATNFGEDAGIFGAPPNVSSIITNIGNNSGLAFFASGKYKFTEKLAMELGVRFDRETRDLRGSQEISVMGGPPSVAQPERSSSASFNAFSPKAILSYQVNPEQLLFASFTRGFRAGGLTPVTSDPSEFPFSSFDPEFSNNFELGFKGDYFDNTLRWNLSAFYTTVQNVQVPQLVLPDALVITTNEGRLNSKGVESEITALFGKNLTFGWNAGFTDARFETLDLAGGEENIDYSGNRQLFTPTFTSLVLGQYNRVLNQEKGVSLLARAEWQWLGKTYFDLPNQLSQDPYHLIHARLGVQIKQLELALWGRNLGNSTYVSYAYNFGAAHLGEPRTFGLSGRLNF